VFHTRCPIAIEECWQVIPEWREVGSDHWVACHRV
jgi:peptide/nickel transport system ATP-binding protein